MNYNFHGNNNNNDCMLWLRYSYQKYSTNSTDITVVWIYAKCVYYLFTHIIDTYKVQKLSIRY